MAGIDYNERIPNNVDLGSNRKLQRALEKWQPDYLSWWNEMGPEGFIKDEVYLRTAISTEPGGWARIARPAGPPPRPIEVPRPWKIRSRTPAFRQTRAIWSWAR